MQNDSCRHSPLANVPYRTVSCGARPGIALAGAATVAIIFGAAAVIAAGGARASTLGALEAAAPRVGAWARADQAMMILVMGSACVMLRGRWGAALA